MMRRLEHADFLDCLRPEAEPLRQPRTNYVSLSVLREAIRFNTGDWEADFGDCTRTNRHTDAFICREIIARGTVYDCQASQYSRASIRDFLNELPYSPRLE